MSTTNDALSMPKTTQTIPMVADSEAATKNPAGGLVCGDQGGLVDEAWLRMLNGGSRRQIISTATGPLRLM